MDREEYFNEKFKYEAEQQRYLEWKDQQRMMKQDYCERDCDGHDEGCPYYDPEEESWDYEACYKDTGGWE